MTTPGDYMSIKIKTEYNPDKMMACDQVGAA